MRAVVCCLVMVGLLLPTLSQCSEKVTAVVRSEGGGDSAGVVIKVDDDSRKAKLFWFVVTEVAGWLGWKAVRKSETGQAPKPLYGYGPENYGPGDEPPWWTYET